VAKDQKRNPQLDAALKKAAKAREELENRRRKVRDLLAAEELAGDKQYAKVAKQIEVLKDQLHKHRIRMSRKRFSVRTRERALEEVRKALAKMQETEQSLAGKLEGLEKQQNEIKDKIVTKVMDQAE